MGLTGGVKSRRLSGQISPYCEKKRHWLCAYCAPMFCVTSQPSTIHFAFCACSLSKPTSNVRKKIGVLYHG